LALMLLALLAEAPMHAYRMQQLLKERGKEKVVNVAQRNSVYQTIDRLQRSGLVEVMETERDQGRPERTVYQMTEEGSQTFYGWLREMLSRPMNEFPEFPAALSTMMLLSADDVTRQLQSRAGVLREWIANEDPTEYIASGALPRLFMLEDEYRVAMLRAELTWVEAVLVDLASGALTWDEQWLRQFTESG
jgi:DNA-binding PadR family transcriptional regulator